MSDRKTIKNYKEPLGYVSHQMRVDYKKKEIVIKYDENFLSGSAEVYARRLQRLVEKIDSGVRDSFQKFPTVSTNKESA